METSSSVKLPSGKAKRILVTRPQPAAARTAHLLQRAGFIADVFPLTETQALSPQIEIKTYAAITITSINALRHADPQLLEAIKHLPLFAVGVRTAEVARDYSFETVIEGGGDAVRLATTMAEHLPQGAEVIYLAGRVRQPIFEERVQATGLVMQVYDIYDTVATHPDPQQIIGQPYAAVLLYSGVTASRLKYLQEQTAKSLFQAGTKFFCIAPRVAELLPAQWKDNSFSADHPDENGIFRLFKHI
ncbi:uroporphyrinogen-III synthase [Paenochrobactrum sp. BZR 588]|uniref:uroporphyrinogen-III synthase n=1 Tax=unclassified Paenochrobactrum TaxID=2639760 RepID=UPI0038554550